MKKISFLILLFVGCMAHTFAQVGINTNSPQATLHIVPQSTGLSTAEGIIAPNLTREQVIAKDTQYGTPQTGAYVYVTTLGNETLTPKTSKITISGYYFFDGAIWQPMDYTPEFIYLPSFNLPLTAGNNKIYNLYTDVYKKQFTKLGNPTFVSSNATLAQIPTLYNANQLDFVVTYYDNSIITVNSIDANGILNYNVLNTNPDTNSFINIVLVVKK